MCNKLLLVTIVKEFIMLTRRNTFSPEDISVISLSLMFSLFKFCSEYKASGTLVKAFFARSTSHKLDNVSKDVGRFATVRCVLRICSVSRLCRDGSCLEKMLVYISQEDDVKFLFSQAKHCAIIKNIILPSLFEF